MRMTRTSAVVACLSFAVVGQRAAAQETVLQPAENARERAAEHSAPAQQLPSPPPAVEAPAQTSVETPAQPAAAQPAAPAPPSAAAPGAPAADDDSSYEARAVIPPAPGTLREEQRIGDYAQPRWTARRRFPTTRIYVRPQGSIGVEWWLETKLDLEDTHAARYRSQYELEMGLGHRLQLDLYLQTEQAGHQAPLELKAEKVELRWALADWGVIPLNPALYVEYVRQHDAPPKIELKALIGEQLARGLHFGFNAVYEHELGDAQENEYALVSGISYAIVDELFSLGAEVKFETVDVEGDRLTFDAWELLAGPSLAWSPTPPMHVLFVALFGNETEAGEHTPLLEPTLVVGWEF